jgi:nucleotide-binding universal stress UspA family protein
MLPFKKIVCPIDFSDASLCALKAACELAGHHGAALMLVHVVPYTPPFPSDLVAISVGAPEPDVTRIENETNRLAEIARQHVPGGIEVSCEVRMGYADKEIVVLAEDSGADLLVISTHGLTGWRHLVFGSVAEAIVRTTRLPVLTVHALATAPAAEAASGIDAKGVAVHGPTADDDQLPPALPVV